LESTDFFFIFSYLLLFLNYLFYVVFIYYFFMLCFQAYGNGTSAQT
jgi:hypothetical protein